MQNYYFDDTLEAYVALDDTSIGYVDIFKFHRHDWGCMVAAATRDGTQVAITTALGHQVTFQRTLPLPEVNRTKLQPGASRPSASRAWYSRSSMLITTSES
jgi:hypothetical protein